MICYTTIHTQNDSPRPRPPNHFSRKRDKEDKIAVETSGPAPLDATTIFVSTGSTYILNYRGCCELLMSKWSSGWICEG